MSKATLIPMALGAEHDLTVPTSDQKYPLGLKIQVEDSDTKMVKEYVYVKAHAALTAYIPYVITYSNTAAGEVTTAAPATLAAPGQYVCVPQVAFTTAYYGFVQVKGHCTAICTNETLAAGDFLQVLTTGVAMVVDGTTGSTTHSVNSCAICKTGTYSSAGNAIILLGDKAVTAAT